MSQLDYFFLFPTQAAAQADATVGGYWDPVNLVWRGDVCFPGLTWLSSQSLSGWMIMISSPVMVPALASHANMILQLDRDKAIAGQAFVITTPGMTGAGHISMVFSPVPHGARYPRPLGQ